MMLLLGLSAHLMVPDDYLMMRLRLTKNKQVLALVTISKTCIKSLLFQFTFTVRDLIHIVR